LVKLVTLIDGLAATTVRVPFDFITLLFLFKSVVRLDEQNSSCKIPGGVGQAVIGRSQQAMMVL